jgi:hypothetical protein
MEGLDIGVGGVLGRDPPKSRLQSSVAEKEPGISVLMVLIEERK